MVFGTSDTEIMRLDDTDDSILLGEGTYTTGEVNGLPFIPSCAGTPTGLPTAHGDLRAVKYDRTNNKLYVENSGWQEIGAGGGGSPLHVTVMADQMENVTNANWSVNGLAPIGTDTNDAALKVRLFDDTTEEGAGLGTYEMPTGTANLKLSFVSRPETAPGGAAAVALTLHVRRIDGSPSAWEQFDLTDIAITTNENWLQDNQTIAFTAFTTDLVAGAEYQFELTRNTADVADDLAGDWTLHKVIVEATA